VTAVSVVVAGGGTAGHIEPAMALADAVRRLESSARITALGTEKGLDRTLIPPRGYPLELIPPVPLPRKMNSALLRMPGRVNDAVRMTADVLVRANADVIVGFGGYVALPAYLAARRARLPIVVHEANARPGVANRLAARLTHHVYTASEQVRLPHAVAIGIPLRPAISGLDRTAMRPRARSAFGLLPDAPTLLVTGGSQGAQSLNRACAGAADALRRAGIQVLHIVGGKNTVAVPPGQPPYAVVPFVEQMHLAYAAADFVLCRCGAMTCAEVSAVGLPAVGGRAVLAPALGIALALLVATTRAQRVAADRASHTPPLVQVYCQRWRRRQIREVPPQQRFRSPHLQNSTVGRTRSWLRTQSLASPT